MNNPRTTLLRALILAAIAVPAAACGDSSDDSNTSSTTPSTGGGGGAGGNAAGSGGSDAGTGGNAAGTGGNAAGTGGNAAGTGGSDAGAGGSGGTGGSGGAGGSAGSGGYPCENPESILVGGKPTGYERCANGAIHRRANLECPSLLPQPKACEQADQGGNCKSDADCTEAPNGFCAVSKGFQTPGCYCNYGCTKDTDCGEGSICLCGEPVGHCVAATCRSDKDCGGGLCNSYGSNQPCFTFGFACQSPKDTCGGNNDCTSSDFCLIDGDHRVCKKDQPCAIGRPLVVEDGWRFAGLVRRASGWA